MIFTVRRASGFPIILEMEEQNSLDILEEKQLWVELENYERELRKSDALKELKVECENLEELLIFLNSINNPLSSMTINFQKKTIIVEDNGDDVQ